MMPEKSKSKSRSVEALRREEEARLSDPDGFVGKAAAGVAAADSFRMRKAIRATNGTREDWGWYLLRPFAPGYALSCRVRPH
jgi:hypothetical protein